MWVLNKRISRNLFANKIRWISILFLVILCVYLVEAYFSEAVIMSYNHAENFKNNNARDGRFTVLAELTESELTKIEETGFILEKEFSFDYPAMENAKLRAFCNREKIDLVFCDEGRKAESSDEMVVEKLFSNANGIRLGDIINVAGLDFSVCGIGGSADAEYVFDIAGEATDHKIFGNCFLTREGYDRLISTGKMIGTENLRYGYKKSDPSQKDSELEDLLRDIDFDESRIKNRFFIEMLNDVLETKINIEKAMNDISEACEELSESSNDFEKSASDMCKAADDFDKAVNNDLVKGIKELNDGAKKLTENSMALKDGADQIFTVFLSNAESSLAGYGLNVKLTPENYERVLKSVDSSGVGSQYADSVDTLLYSLREVETFCNGVNSYTSGVENAAVGASELSVALGSLSTASVQVKNGLNQYASLSEFNGMLDEINLGYQSIDDGIAQTKEGSVRLSDALSVINVSSSVLKNGADNIFNMLLSDVSSRMGDLNISVDLNRDNYKYVLEDVKNNINQNVSEASLKSVNELIESLNSFNAFRKGLNDYVDGAGKLYNGIKELYESTSDLVKNSSDLKDASYKFADHTGELKDGVKNFNEGISGFKDNIDELNDLFDVEIDIIELFEPLSYNAGIQNTADGTMQQAAAIGMISLLLIGFIFTVFISHEIDNESAVIGALYSMGVRKRSLIKHYIMIPAIVSFTGGIVGTIAGLSPIGVDMMLGSTETFYSLPRFVRHYNIWVIIAGIFIPVLISVIITLIVINSKLSKSPLSLLRHEKKIKKIKGIGIKSKSFLYSFRIKQIIHESGISAVVFVGLFLPLILMTLLLNYGVALKPLVENVKKEIVFENMCVMKYAPKDIPAGSEDVYIESLEMSGKIDNCDVSVVGIRNDSECFNFSISESTRNSVSVGSGMSLKYGVKKGDVITLYANDKHRYYTFLVDSIVDYSMGLYVFMDIDDMRDIFGRVDDYYNTLVSNEKIEIEAERIFSFYTKESIISNAERQYENMYFQIVVFILVSVIVFFLVTYLMIKLMIDRAAMNISLFKIFGYHKYEIKKLYIDGNFYVILLSAVLGIPLSKLFVDEIWLPAININIDFGYDVKYPVWLYLLILVTIIVLYLIISNILKLVINKIHMSDVLKNRE